MTPSLLKRRICIVLVIFLSSTLKISAQDYHFSQFYINQIENNPSHTGAFDGIVRGSIVSRSQWLAVTKPFLTLSAQVDGAVYRNNRRQELLALGIVFNGDKAGDVNYSSVQAIASISYIKNIGWRNRHKIGIGLYGGIINNSLDETLSTWDNQFYNGIFNPGISSGENIAPFHRLYADFGIGAFWSYLPSRNILLRLSFGAAHINRPFYEFGESEARLPVKYSTHLYSQIALSDKISIYPMIYFGKQKQYNEILFGSNLEFFKKKNSYTNLYTIGGGIFYRWNDAIIFNGFVSWQNLRFSVAYDVNVSPFRVATYGRGALELAVTYIFKRKSITRLGKEPCPYDIM